MTVTTEAAPLHDRAKRLLGYAYQGALGDLYRGLVFTDSGKARLSHIAGFLEGLSLAGKQELAEKMTLELDGHLHHLSQYGGDIEAPVDDGEYGAVAKYGAYRVVLGDDGTFGGFSLMWYRAISPKDMRRIMDDNPMIDTPEHRESWSAWKQRLGEKFNIRKDLEQWVCYDQYPDRELPYEGAKRMESTYIQYRYSFNGGLLFHGFGHDPGAVCLDRVVNGSQRFWSTHT
jgi:hypothetical protein